MENKLLLKIRNQEELSFKEQVLVVIQLSIPAIMAQLSSTIMHFIDASMVGQLGANESASIGLVSSATWLMNGSIMAFNIGFSVQIAQRIGAKEDREARNIFIQAIFSVLIWVLIVMGIGLIISSYLPKWLHADPAIWDRSSGYLRIYC